MSTEGAAFVSLERVYQQSAGDPPFTRILTAHPDLVDDDEELAHLIEADGRHRIEAGLAVNLERYLNAVDDLPTRAVSLDAALDVVLRSLSGGSSITMAAVDELVRRYPALALPIHEAAALGNAIWSTNTLRDRIASGRIRQLPADFGPPLDDGRARFELRELLGTGASGEVYLAVDRHLSEEAHEAVVAIKIVPRPPGSHWRKHADDEALKARRIDHPNVVRVIDRGFTDADETFIVYEYVDGGDLTRWIEDFGVRVPPRAAASMMAKIARGVQAAHNAGLVHCDLKPGNIMLTKAGEPKVADFGIAVREGESFTSKYTATDETPIGNLAFISPEQYRMDHDALAATSDVYSLGGMLYLMVTGALPNGSTGEEIARTHDRETGRKEAPSPRAINPNIDRDLDLICRRALAPEPKNRYTAAVLLANDLEAWMGHEPLPWTRPSPARVASLWVRKRPGRAIGVGAILVLMTLGGYFGYESKRRHDERRATLSAASEIVKRLQLVNEDRPPTTLLFHGAWVLQYMFAPPFLASPIDTHDIFLAKLNNLEKFIAQAEAAGRADDLFTQLYRLTAAMWRLGAGQYHQARAHLRQLSSLAERLPPDDPAIGMIEALNAAADVLEILDHAKNTPLTEARRAQLRAARTLIEREELLIAQSDSGSPYHLLLIDMLVQLHGERGLNDPQRVTELEDAARRAESRPLLFPD